MTCAVVGQHLLTIIAGERWPNASDLLPELIVRGSTAAEFSLCDLKPRRVAHLLQPEPWRWHRLSGLRTCQR